MSPPRGAIVTVGQTGADEGQPGRRERGIYAASRLDHSFAPPFTRSDLIGIVAHNFYIISRGEFSGA